MKQRKYPSDLSDAQWAAVEPFMKRSDSRGNPGKYDKRRIGEAILCVRCAGCRWRSLPHDFPPWESVCDHFRRWQERAVWAEIALALARADRIQAGREPEPSVALIDSQRVKSTGAGEEHGFHGGKRIKGRSRHVVTDTGGPHPGRARDLGQESRLPGDGPHPCAGQGALRGPGGHRGRRGLQAPSRTSRRSPGHAPVGGQKSRPEGLPGPPLALGGRGGPSPGWATSAASPRTMRGLPGTPRPSFGSPARSSCSTAWTARPETFSSTGSECR